jgi:hypothetical protein
MTPHLKNQWVERRCRSANPMIFLPLPLGERKKEHQKKLTGSTSTVTRTEAGTFTSTSQALR